MSLLFFLQRSPFARSASLVAPLRTNRANSRQTMYAVNFGREREGEREREREREREGEGEKEGEGEREGERERKESGRESFLQGDLFHSRRRRHGNMCADRFVVVVRQSSFATHNLSRRSRGTRLAFLPTRNVSFGKDKKRAHFCLGFGG